MRNLVEIWQDQKQFNLQIRPAPMKLEDQEKQTQYFVMCLLSELDEILKCINWKHHRRKPVQVNEARVAEELTDIFKIWLSMAQVWGLSPEKFIEEYWRKSTVVRQRFNQEYMQSLDCDSVIVDIDEVLCDFFNGMIDWMINNKVWLGKPDLYERLVMLKSQGKRVWLNHENLGIDPEVWMRIKEGFRLSGGISRLPLMPGAEEMLTRFRSRGLNIIVLTSRPVDKYPHLVADTIAWLNSNNLPYNFIWFSKKKADEILRAGNRQRILFAIDDDPKFINEYSGLGIESYMYRPNKDWDQFTLLKPDLVHPVSSLEEIS